MSSPHCHDFTCCSLPVEFGSISSGPLAAPGTGCDCGGTWPAPTSEALGFGVDSGGGVGDFPLRRVRTCNLRSSTKVVNNAEDD